MADVMCGAGEKISVQTVDEVVEKPLNKLESRPVAHGYDLNEIIRCTLCLQNATNGCVFGRKIS